MARKMAKRYIPDPPCYFPRACSGRQFRPTDGTCEAIMWNELGGIGRADSSLPEFDNGKRRNSGSPTMAATAWDSRRRDRFDLQQEIGVGEPAQNAQRAGRGLAGGIQLPNAPALRP